GFRPHYSGARAGESLFAARLVSLVESLGHHMKNMKKKLLAVASGGGHWIQLLRLRPAFAGLEVQYISTHPSLAHKVAPSKTYAVRDANMWDKPGLLIMAVQVMLIILCYRLDVVVTTGAAPGYFALVFGRLMGAKTIWIDSI